MARKVTGVAILAIVAILVPIALTLSASSGFAAEVFKMGVVDPQAVLEKTKAGRRALDALKDYATTRQKLIAGDEEELRNIEKQLKDQESTLSEAQKREKQSQFRTKLQDYQKRAQDFNQELVVKQKEMVDEYMKKIGAATRTVAEKGGFTLVVDKGSENTVKIVIYNRDNVDITELVIKEFDRQNK